MGWENLSCSTAEIIVSSSAVWPPTEQRTWTLANVSPSRLSVWERRLCFHLRVSRESSRLWEISHAKYNLPIYDHMYYLSRRLMSFSSYGLSSAHEITWEGRDISKKDRKMDQSQVHTEIYYCKKSKERMIKAKIFTKGRNLIAPISLGY